MPEMPPPMTRICFASPPESAMSVIEPLSLPKRGPFTPRSGSPPGRPPLLQHRGLEPHRALVEEGETQPEHGELQEFLVVPCDGGHPGLVHLEALQEPALQNESPEAVEVVTGHEVHLHGLGGQCLLLLPELVEHQSLEGGPVHLVLLQALPGEPLPYRAPGSLPVAVAEFLADEEVESPLLGGRRARFGQPEGVHSTGPGAVVVDRAAGLGDQRAAPALGVHAQSTAGIFCSGVKGEMV